MADKGENKNKDQKQSKGQGQGQGEGKVNPIQVQKFLGGIDYPCSKNDLIKTAEGKGADERVMNMLNRLPDKEYDAPTAVTREIGNLQR